MYKDSDWVADKIKKLKDLSEECKDEMALSRYIGCMVRLVNGLAQMYHSQFHYYEMTILWGAMNIFTGHFIEQIQKAKNIINVYDKRKLIDDIENAVDRMTGVYRNVIDSTANSDRQMLSGVSVDTSIYELSPKLCSFYSKILNELVRMFGEEDNYAFVLHPTLKNNTETQIMFDCREESGKVVIIYISESIIEDIDVVPVFLLHEAFHVLTKERQREKRLGYYIQLLLDGIRQLLFQDVEFSEDKCEDVEIKEYFTKIFFKDDIEREAEIWKNEKDTRKFYGNNVIKWAINYFFDCLMKINANLEIWITVDSVCQNAHTMEYQEFYKKYKRVMECKDQLRKNLLDIVYMNKISFMAERFMFIFRGIYADIACILTLHLQQKNYEQAFEKSKQYKFCTLNFRDSIQQLRNYIVTSTVMKTLPDQVAKSWEKCKRQLDHLNEESRQNQLTFGNANVIIDETSLMEEVFLEYAECCAEAFRAHIENTLHINRFRQNMSNIRNQGIDRKNKLLMSIMMDGFNEVLDQV